MRTKRWTSFGLLAVLMGLGAASPSNAGSPFSFVDDPGEKTMTVLDGARPVLTSCCGDNLKLGADPKYVRSGYVHPLYGLVGAILTDGFPADHLHHHGLFWTWPIILVRSLRTGTWELAEPPLRQRLERWTEKAAEDGWAFLGIEGSWVLDGREKVACESVRIVVYPAAARAIDIEIAVTPLGGPLVFQGSQDAGKGYGGLCFRGAPLFKGAVLTTDRGVQAADAVNTTNAWADLPANAGGIAVFVHPVHPGYPIPWLVRNSYAGILNPSWPGLKAEEIAAGRAVTLRYRLFIHRGDAAAARVAERYNRHAALIGPRSGAKQVSSERPARRVECRIKSPSHPERGRPRPTLGAVPDKRNPRIYSL